MKCSKLFLQGIKKFEIEFPESSEQTGVSGSWCEKEDGLSTGQSGSSSVLVGEEKPSLDSASSGAPDRDQWNVMVNGEPSADDDRTTSVQWKYLDLKRKIQELTGVSIENQRLIHRGKVAILLGRSKCPAYCMFCEYENPDIRSSPIRSPFVNPHWGDLRRILL